MKPYYDHAGITIYHADALELLPVLCPVGLNPVDVVLADPPYGIDGARGGVNVQRAKGQYRASGWADTPRNVREVCVPVIEEAIEAVGRVAAGVPLFLKQLGGPAGAKRGGAEAVLDGCLHQQMPGGVVNR